MEDKNKVTIEEIYTEEVYATWYKCNECGCVDILDTFNFCPNCGKELDW